jgi:hypothetical protein
MAECATLLNSNSIGNVRIRKLKWFKIASVLEDFHITHQYSSVCYGDTVFCSSFWNK